MNSAVRGKSALTRLTTSSTSAAPPPTSTVMPAGGASAEPSSRRSATSARASARFGPYGVYSVNAVRSSLVVAASASWTNRSRGPPGAVEQLVLLQGQPRVDVDEAGHAADARIRREPARVVVELGDVVGGRRRAVRPDRERERRELALAELAASRSNEAREGRRPAGSTRPAR